MTSRDQRFSKAGAVGRVKGPSRRALKNALKLAPAAPTSARPSDKDETTLLPELLSRMPLDLLGRSAWPIDEITVRLAGLSPAPSFQAIAKFRDRTKAWAVWVDNDPAVALVKCLQLAMQGPEYAEQHSLIRFFDRKSKAEEHGSTIRQENADLVGNMHVEFEPYMGFIAVMFLREGADETEAHRRFGLLCEIRTSEHAPLTRDRRVEGMVHQSRAGGTAPSETPKKSPAGRGSRSAPTSTKADPRKAPTAPKNEGVAATPVVSRRPTREELEPQKKSALIKIHQQLFGKQPNNKLSPEEIVNLILSKLPKE